MTTSQDPSDRTQPKIYGVRHTNAGEYEAAFSEIGGWDAVILWASDGSIVKGDTVFELIKTEQPEITEVTS